MGKSIRSKIKRKHRTEFRATIGNVAFQANMAVIQNNLKDSIEKQSLKSLDKLSNQLSSSIGDDNAMNTDNDSGITTRMDLPDAIPIDSDSATKPRTTTATTTTNVLGENKVGVYRKTGQNKHRISALEQKRSRRNKEKEDEKPKRKPRFFCQF